MDWLGGLGHLLIVNRTQIRDEDDGLYRELGRRLNDGRVIGLCESYRNCGWQPVDYGGLPFASTLGATYQDAGCAGCTLEHLYELGFAAHRDSFYTASWDADYYRAAR
jgi:hypothetical protein